MPELIRDLLTIAEPDYEPLSLAEAKNFCRVETSMTNDDALIGALIRAARERAESITGRSFIPRTLELVLDAFPDGDAALELPGSPVLTLASISYTDSAGDAQTADVSEFTLVPCGKMPARLVPSTGFHWPVAGSLPGNVRIRYLAGYAASGSPDDEAAYQAALPGLLKSWMQVRIATLYDNRDSIVMGQIQEWPRDYVDGLLDSLTLVRGFA